MEPLRHTMPLRHTIAAGITVSVGLLARAAACARRGGRAGLSASDLPPAPSERALGGGRIRPGIVIGCC
jgi:hypothetical protein